MHSETKRMLENALESLLSKKQSEKLKNATTEDLIYFISVFHRLNRNKEAFRQIFDLVYQQRKLKKKITEKLKELYLKSLLQSPSFCLTFKSIKSQK